MPLDELAGGLLHGLGRFIGQFMIEVVLEILIKGPGFLITKHLIRKKSIEPDDVLVVFVGFLFWGVIGLLSYMIYRMM